MKDLIITVEFSDDSDFDWLRTRMVGAVEEVLEEQTEQGKVDGKVEVSWDTGDSS